MTYNVFQNRAENADVRRKTVKIGWKHRTPKIMICVLRTQLH